MKKGLLSVGIMMFILTGCNESKNKAIIKSDGARLDVITCYKDSKGNEKCFGSELGLYAEYQNKRLTIEDALNQNLITLDDVQEAYDKIVKND